LHPALTATVYLETIMATNTTNPKRPETLTGIDWLSLAIFLSPIAIAFAAEMAR